MERADMRKPPASFLPLLIRISPCSPSRPLNVNLASGARSQANPKVSPGAIPLGPQETPWGEPTETVVTTTPSIPPWLEVCPEFPRFSTGSAQFSYILRVCSLEWGDLSDDFFCFLAHIGHVVQKSAFLTRQKKRGRLRPDM